MITTDTVTDYTTNDLSTTTTQNSYDGIKPPLGYQITEDLKLCSSTNAKKISALTKEACIALGLPLDTKGGNKPPEHNIAIFKWLRDNKTTSAELTDLPTVEPVAPAEEITEAIESKTTTADLFGIDATLETVTTSNQNEPTVIAEYKQTECFEPVTDAPSLKDLAVEINLLNEQVEHSKSQALIFAARTGEKLLMAKAQCKHGEFGAWLSDNCTVSQSYANSFMKIAVEMPHLLISNSQTSVNLSLNQTIELLSATNEVKNEVTAKLEAGENVTVNKIKQIKKQSKKVESADLVALVETQIIEPLTPTIITDNVLPIEPPDLAVDVGALSIHQSAIEQIKTDLSSLAFQLSNAFKTGVVPNDVTNDWYLISNEIKDISTQIDDFFDAIDGAVLVAEVVTL